MYKKLEEDKISRLREISRRYMMSKNSEENSKKPSVYHVPGIVLPQKIFPRPYS